MDVGEKPKRSNKATPAPDSARHRAQKEPQQVRPFSRSRFDPGCICSRFAASPQSRPLEMARNKVVTEASGNGTEALEAGIAAVVAIAAVVRRGGR